MIDLNRNFERLAVDVAIVGAGMAGSAAAVALGRAGYNIALIDRNEVYPPEFRAEKIAGPQIGLLKGLDLFEVVTGVATPYDDIVSARGNRKATHRRIQEYGIPYQTMVGAVRGAIPSEVQRVTGIVTELKTSNGVQEIRLSDGRQLEARLIVLATGLNGNLVESLGICHRFVHKGHTLCIGFTVEPKGKDKFDFTALTYHGAGVTDKIDYVSFFPMAGAMRANLFSFHSLHDEWARRMRDAPAETLLATLPHLRKFTGDLAVVGKAKLRSIDLRFASNHKTPGIVLVGDAFQTSCPAAGTGITRALTDVERLCNVYIPEWLKSPGMRAEKISQYYDDDVKKKSDAHAYHVSQYRRSITIDTSIPWRLRRRLLIPMNFAQNFVGKTMQSSARVTASIRAGLASIAQP